MLKTDGETLIFFWALIWVAVLVLMLIRFSRKQDAGSGLILGYLFNFWLLHWPGAVAYLSSSSTAVDLDIVEVGFRLSTYGMISFVVGNLVFAPKIVNALKLRRAKNSPQISETKAGKTFVLVGLLFYVAMSSFLFQLPTVRSLIASGWQFIVVGIALMIWNAWHEKKLNRVWMMLGITLCVPLFTLITQGFVSYGVTALLAIFAFTATFYRPRAKLVIVGLIIGYLGFSFYIGYMRERATIREAVWSGQEYSVRAERMMSIFTSFELFNPFDSEHLKRIDDRLNQNLLVGASVSYMENGYNEFAHGSTLVEAFQALMPRALWPDKPIVAGSSDMVSNYTGIGFAEGTSVGVGQVLEFYINFGTIGILVGFLVFGIVVTVFDQISMDHLSNGSWRGFTLWFLPGLAFLQVGGQLVEITAGAASAVGIAFLVTWGMSRYYRARTNKSAGAFKNIPQVSSSGLVIDSPKQDALESGVD